jgi:hypothetical protein
MALGLPNVCVYPGSLLKFHKAYNANTREVDEGVSAELFRSYPAAVQARLGGLTREYRVLTGTELIALGMRNCNGGGMQVARARQPEAAPTVSAPEPSLFGALAAAFAPKAVDPSPFATLRSAKVKVAISPSPDEKTPTHRLVKSAPLPTPGWPRLISGAEPALSGALAAGVQFRPYRLD